MATAAAAPTTNPSRGGATAIELRERLHTARLNALLGEPVGTGGSELETLIARTAELVAGSLNDETRRTYARRWQLFVTWCEAHSMCALPADAPTVMLYITAALEETPGSALSTVRGWVAAINRVHLEAGLPTPGSDPAMTVFLRSLRARARGRARQEPVSALRIQLLRSVCQGLSALECDPTEVRDKALLGLHRAGVGDGELARLSWVDITWTPRAKLLLRSPRHDRSNRSLVLTPMRGKDDCPVAALNRWRAIQGETVEHVFTLLDASGTPRSDPWDSRAIRRVRLSRVDAIAGTPGAESIRTAMSILGGAPSEVLRDRALLLLGFAGAFRRPDLVGLYWRDLRTADEGLVVRLARSKTDRVGRGVDVGIPQGKSALTCPVAAMLRWRARVEAFHGPDVDDLPCFPPVGRSGRIGETPITPEALTRVVRRRLEQAALPGRWGGRSLRAGFISTAADLDIPLEAIARQSRHATLDSLVLYIRQEDPFRRNPAGRVGL